jgi:nucleoside-diphosphate-sugar epimerase
MASIAVIGGTRFFGKILVQDLLDKGHQVTLITRGNSKDDFGTGVTRLTADANNKDSLAEAVDGHTFDVVHHQVCYSPIAAAAAVEAFTGRTRKLVMTSSMEVYNKDTFRWQVPAPKISTYCKESELDPTTYGHDVDLPWLDDAYLGPNYGEGKRQAESYLVQKADFEVAIARLSHVLAYEDEFTGRFTFHYNHIRDSKPMRSFKNPGKTSYVSAQDAGKFLSWLGDSTVTGPLNGASPDYATVHDMTALMANVIGGKAIIEEVEDAPTAQDLSAFSCPSDYGLNVDLAAANGFEFTPITTWLPTETRAAKAAEEKA